MSALAFGSSRRIGQFHQGVKKLLALIEEQATDVVWIEYPDRLVRFGGSILEQAFRWKGVRIEVLEPLTQSEPTEE